MPHRESTPASWAASRERKADQLPEKLLQKWWSMGPRPLGQVFHQSKSHRCPTGHWQRQKLAKTRPPKPTMHEANLFASSKQELSTCLLSSRYATRTCRNLTPWSKEPRLQTTDSSFGFHVGTSKAQSAEVLDAMECPAWFHSHFPCGSFLSSFSNGKLKKLKVMSEMSVISGSGHSPPPLPAPAGQWRKYPSPLSHCWAQGHLQIAVKNWVLHRNWSLLHEFLLHSCSNSVLLPWHTGETETCRSLEVSNGWFFWFVDFPHARAVHQLNVWMTTWIEM